MFQKKKQSKTILNSAGMGLIQVIVTVGIFAILTYQIIGSIGIIGKAQKNLSDTNAVQSLSTSLNQLLSRRLVCSCLFNTIQIGTPQTYNTDGSAPTLAEISDPTNILFQSVPAPEIRYTDETCSAGGSLLLPQSGQGLGGNSTITVQTSDLVNMESIGMNTIKAVHRVVLQKTGDTIGSSITTINSPILFNVTGHSLSGAGLTATISGCAGDSDAIETHQVKIIRGGNTVIRISNWNPGVGYLTVQMNDGSFKTRLFPNPPPYAQFNLAGAGVLDAGGLAANSWYYLYLVPSGGTSWTLRASLNRPGVGPVGLPIFRYIGAVVTNSATQIVRFHHAGRGKFLYRSPEPTISFNQNTNPAVPAGGPNGLAPTAPPATNDWPLNHLNNPPEIRSVLPQTAYTVRLKLRIVGAGGASGSLGVTVRSAAFPLFGPWGGVLGEVNAPNSIAVPLVLAWEDNSTVDVHLHDPIADQRIGVIFTNNAIGAGVLIATIDVLGWFDPLADNL